MKNGFSFLVAFFLVTALSSLSLNAQSVQTLKVNKDGEYRVSDDQTWQETGIIVDPAALKYLEFFSEVISSPNQPIFFVRSEKMLKFKPIFKRLVTVTKEEIRYDDKNSRIVYRLTSEQKNEGTCLALFGIISIIFMILSNISLYRQRPDIRCPGFDGANSFAVVTAAIAAFAAAFAAAGAIIIVGAAVDIFAAIGVIDFVVFVVAAVASTVAALVAALAANDNRKYQRRSITYYALMILYFVLLYS